MTTRARKTLTAVAVATCFLSATATTYAKDVTLERVVLPLSGTAAIDRIEAFWKILHDGRQIEVTKEGGVTQVVDITTNKVYGFGDGGSARGRVLLVSEFSADTDVIQDTWICESPKTREMMANVARGRSE